MAKDLLLFQSMQRGSREIATIEPDYDITAIAPFDDPGFPKIHFIEHRYSHDETNWWVPNRACVEAMLRSSGFAIEAQPEDEVYVCRWQETPVTADGPHCVYPARDPDKGTTGMICDVTQEGKATIARAEDLLARRQLPEALECLEQAEGSGADPDRCAAARWLCSMLLGDFEAAWQQSDAIRGRGAPDPHRFWQGEQLAGKRVILRCLHGFGDAVQFLRYVPRLQEVVAGLIIEVPPRFLALAHCIDGVKEVTTWGDDAPAEDPEWDVQIEVMELPYVFRTLLRELPIRTHYMKPPAIDLPRSSSENPRVGVAWSAGSWNMARSIPLDHLHNIVGTEGCEFWSLEGGPGRPDSELAGVREHSASRTTIEDLAATIAQLDLVITADTLAAHLAGAMGKPAWVLLQFEADWRWLHEREDSPWYPSLRLFRQQHPGDWAGLALEVRAALEQWISNEQQKKRAA